MAIIGADASPMARELAAVQRMARTTGASIGDGLGSGMAHGGRTIAMRETLVLMREISRGNWTRVPGSLSLLLSQFGLLKLLVKDTTNQAAIMAEAWAKETAMANLAAEGAVRKAAASTSAFNADVNATEAELNLAVADERGAAQAILYAKATQAKADAADYNARAQAASAEAETATLTPLASILVVAIAIGTAFFIWNKRVQEITKSLAGMKMPDLNTSPDRISAQMEATKKISDSIEKQKFDASLKGKTPDELRAISAAKKSEADAMKIDTEEHARRTEEDLKRQADAAREFLYGKDGKGGALDELQYETEGKWKHPLLPTRDYFKYGLMSTPEILNTLQDQISPAQSAINQYRDAVTARRGRDALRAQQQTLYSESEQAASAAEKDADKAEKAESLRREMRHGAVNNLEKIAGSSAAAVGISVAQKSEQHLSRIDRNIERIANGNYGGVTH